MVKFEKKIHMIFLVINWPLKILKFDIAILQIYAISQKV